ncbi:hypothetical protein OUZ56_021542 [Daphnia magna]|uniref:Integrase core domain-containing protein n=1 Tax=Daphnia magna TaxID=35525 RepID=A0ABQ9ZIC4_9CRUS|nr:hypothetical protein OUZ56_021542 [Daphnia magna]
MSVLFEKCLTCGASIKLSILEKHVTNWDGKFVIILSPTGVTPVLKQYSNHRVPVEEICQKLSVSMTSLFRVMKESKLSARQNYTHVSDDKFANVQGILSIPKCFIKTEETEIMLIGRPNKYGFIIHGAIDGYSRLIPYISLENNNNSETVVGLFEKSVEEWGYPASVRSDLGGENVLVANFMINARGVIRNSFRTGKSVHNQRVE